MDPWRCEKPGAEGRDAEVETAPTRVSEAIVLDAEFPHCAALKAELARLRVSIEASPVRERFYDCAACCAGASIFCLRTR